MQTYWAEPYAESRTSADYQNVPDLNGGSLERLIQWQVAIFKDALEAICSHREARSAKGGSTGTLLSRSAKKLSTAVSTGPRSEIQEVIKLPAYEKVVTARFELGQDVLSQLHQFISAIAHRYGANFFHSFEHACHMTLGTQKLLTRVSSKNMTEEELSSCTYGITSDPLTAFAILFVALIHDVEHAGVTNGRLIEEGSPIAKQYDNKSVAEQNSIDVAWGLLMQDKFAKLRDCIFSNSKERDRFRQTIVNGVMATDIFDPELKEARTVKWSKAFSDEGDDASNRKATVVMEHIIQAADVSHTMQHWNVYRKWNERLFFECCHAYEQGRSDKDPMDGWYKGELWFFDNYVIPLAKKLKKFNVFGGSCDELLAFAVQNRNEWEAKGEGVVKEMKQSFAALTPSSINKNDQSAMDSKNSFGDSNNMDMDESPMVALMKGDISAASPTIKTVVWV